MMMMVMVRQRDCRHIKPHSPLILLFIIHHSLPLLEVLLLLPLPEEDPLLVLPLDLLLVPLLEEGDTERRAGALRLGGLGLGLALLLRRGLRLGLGRLLRGGLLLRVLPPREEGRGGLLEDTLLLGGLTPLLVLVLRRGGLRLRLLPLPGLLVLVLGCCCCCCCSRLLSGLGSLLRETPTARAGEGLLPLALFASLSWS